MHGGRGHDICIGLIPMNRPPHSDYQSEDDCGESENQQERYC